MNKNESSIPPSQPRLPNTFTDLSKDAPLRYDLNESGKFQPVHLDFRSRLPFVILGRFLGSVKGGGNTFGLETIELAVYTWNSSPKFPPLFLVDETQTTIDTTKSNESELHINVSLIWEKDIDDDIRRRRFMNARPECVLQLNNHGVPKGGRIYFTITNYDDFPMMADGGYDLNDLYIDGRHCNGEPSFPGGRT